MAYMRGEPFYVWASDAALHIWKAGDPDTAFMRVSGWAAGHDPALLTSVAVPHRTFDELVVMRHAEMTEGERTNAERRAVRKWGGNSGCDALCVKRGLPGFAARVDALMAKGE